MRRRPLDGQRASIEQDEHGWFSQTRHGLQKFFLVAGQVEAGERRGFARHFRGRFSQGQDHHAGLSRRGEGVVKTGVGIGENVRALGVKEFRFRGRAPVLQRRAERDGVPGLARRRP